METSKRHKKGNKNQCRLDKNLNVDGTFRLVEN